ncbi:hypothetical protein [Roseibium alexandrii]|nr:hypothetical protein [Roseibium alexandrii]
MQLTYAQGGVRFGVPEQTKKTRPVEAAWNVPPTPKKVKLLS